MRPLSQPLKYGSKIKVEVEDFKFFSLFRVKNCKVVYLYIRAFSSPYIHSTSFDVIPFELPTTSKMSLKVHHLLLYLYYFFSVYFLILNCKRRSSLRSCFKFPNPILYFCPSSSQYMSREYGTVPEYFPPLAFPLIRKTLSI